MSQTLQYERMSSRTSALYKNPNKHTNTISLYHASPSRRSIQACQVPQTLHRFCRILPFIRIVLCPTTLFSRRRRYQRGSWRRTRARWTRWWTRWRRLNPERIIVVRVWLSLRHWNTIYVTDFPPTPFPGPFALRLRESLESEIDLD